MIHVIAIVKAKRGQRDSVLQAFRTNVPAVRAEQGCIEYEATVDSRPVLNFQAEFGPDTSMAAPSSSKWWRQTAWRVDDPFQHTVEQGGANPI